MQRIGLTGLFQRSDETAASGGLVLAVVVAASIVSALSGTGRGIKWFSVSNVVLSILLLCAFLIYGSTWFELRMFVECIVDYVINLPALLFSVWTPDGTGPGNELAQWQGTWTIFHLAWWVVFAPFTGMFLARISKGRTIREFVVGTMIVPAIMSFLWFTWAGGTAIDLEMAGVAQGAINSAPDASKIFTMAELLASPVSGFVMSLVIVVLSLTYMITSADSAFFVISSVATTADEYGNAKSNVVVWGVVTGTIAATMLVVDGMSAMQTAMVACAAPFTAVMLLMGVSLIKDVVNDGRTSLPGVVVQG
jgi:choline-glycine betaine transporter